MGSALKGIATGGLSLIPDAFNSLGDQGPPNMQAKTQNSALDQENKDQTSLQDAGYGNTKNSFASGGLTNDQATQGLNQAQQNDLASGATTGSRFATNAVKGNDLLMGGLNSMKGQLDRGQGLQDDQTSRMHTMQDQGFQLTPEDQSMYGQEAGNVGRMFGMQGNNAANDLAARGLSNSGVAGATFSGLQGNQNEMLAKAQQSIMQQRFQNTQDQIKQQQAFIGNLNSQNNQAAGNYADQGAKDINQQYARQQQGSEDYNKNLQAAASGTTKDNAASNAANLDAATFNQDNKPMGFGDYLKAGLGSTVQSIGSAPGQMISSAAGAAGKGAGKSMFAGG